MEEIIIGGKPKQIIDRLKFIAIIRIRRAVEIDGKALIKVKQPQTADQIIRCLKSRSFIRVLWPDVS